MCGPELLLFLLPVLTMAIFFAVLGLPGNARETTKLLNLPPGKLSRLPLVGEALSFFKPHYSPFVGDFLDQRMHRYGSIFKMNILGEPTIVSLDKEFNKLVLQNEEATFLTSYPKSMLAILGTASMGFQTGVHHQMFRSILNILVNGNNLRARLLPVVDREASLLLDSWRRYSSSFSAVEECKKSRSFILKVFKRKLEEITKDEDKDERDGMASILAKDANLTTDQVLDTLLGTGFGGYGTPANALSLAMYFLRSCPSAIKQLREEHMAISESKRRKGERTLTWLDYKQMEFTHCVTNETLRLGSIATLSFRRAIRDVSYKGFDIPNGWKVITVMSAAHRDPSIYEDPLAFNPWRWKARSTTTNDENMMPFGYGPRLCPGSELSKVAMAIFLHHLVLRYDWESTEEDNPMFFPFVHFRKGFPIKVFLNHN